MNDSPEPSPMDVPLYCERCRRVTAHYRSEAQSGDYSVADIEMSLLPAPRGDEVWICSECALVDVLVEVSSLASAPGAHVQTCNAQNRS